MNIVEKDIVRLLVKEEIYRQREIASRIGYSLGMVNRSMQELREKGLIDENAIVTHKARRLLERHRPKRAIILAAGFGMRMVPVNLNMPKALLQVHGETLIERLIHQLQAVGVHEIYVVVGFQREKFDYLIDRYGVELIVNPEYAQKNNLHSLYLAKEHLDNAYIVPCDLYCRENPFSQDELYSWYMVGEERVESDIRVMKKREIIRKGAHELGQRMIGIAYITTDEAENLREKLTQAEKESRYDHAFWEEMLYEKDRMMIVANLAKEGMVTEIDTYEDLLAIDKDSESLQSEAIDTICEALQVDASTIRNIKILKKGMTNRSFLFTANDQKYIMRIPGEGTAELINRQEEAVVYELINGKNICDDVIYINPENGYKITKFMENGRTCNLHDEEDLRDCMGFLKRFHELEMTVDHEFSLFDKIDFYESLWNGEQSAYPDYNTVKAHIMSLAPFIKKHVEKKILTHVDAVPDNFLIVEKNGMKKIRLLDWEYAAMQDPHIDIAMFSIYALYNQQEVDRLIDMYFDGACEEITRMKIYAYVAACGLLWSNWCEYKRNLGVEFGEYSLKQYRYAKDFYRLVAEFIETEGDL